MRYGHTEAPAHAGNNLRQLEAVCTNATAALFIMDARRRRTELIVFIRDPEVNVLLPA